MNSSPRILILPTAVSAVGYYRFTIPYRILKKAGFDVTLDLSLASRHPRGEELEKVMRSKVGTFDLLHTEIWRTVRDGQYFRGAVQFTEGARLNIDCDDDFLNIPYWNQAFDSYQPGQEFREASLHALRVSEHCTVTTQDLYNKLNTRSHACLIAENRLDLADWTNLPTNPNRPKDPNLRILYGGAAGHYGDIEAIRDALETYFANPPRPTRLICLGSVPRYIHDLRRKYPKNILCLDWTPFPDYPAVVAWGGFDLAIAPLADHTHNNAKSNIKWLEAAAQGIPFIGSKVGAYSTVPNDSALIIPNTSEAWLEALTEATTRPDLRQTLRTRAYASLLENWTTDQPTTSWTSMVESAMSRPRIETLADTELPAES